MQAMRCPSTGGPSKIRRHLLVLSAGIGLATILVSGHALAEPRLGEKTATEVFANPRVSQLIAAALRHDAAAVKLAVANGAPTNAGGDEGMTPLAWLEASSDPGGMALLPENGADPGFYAPLDSDGIGINWRERGIHIGR